MSQASPMKLGILGINGRMGQEIVRAVQEDASFVVVAGSVRQLKIEGSIFLSQQASDVFERADVVLDFSHPEAFLTHAAAAQRARKPFLVGTTGLKEGALDRMKELAKVLPILHAPNTSLGIALMQKAVHMLAQNLDLDYDVEILDLHHRTKKDAPSGTAILLGQTVREGRACVERTQGGICSQGDRQKGDIGIASLRGGQIYGEHQVSFISTEERLTLTHEGYSRSVFAKGALVAAKWLLSQTAGFYKMTNVFSL